MARRHLTAALTLGLAASMAALAPAPSSAQSSRFQLETVGSRLVRLDRETGAVAVCRETAGDLRCETVVEADGGAGQLRALRLENRRLSARVSALEARLERIGALAGRPVAAGTTGPDTAAFRADGGAGGEGAANQDTANQDTANQDTVTQDTATERTANGGAGDARTGIDSEAVRREIDEVAAVTLYGLQQFIGIVEALRAARP